MMFIIGLLLILGGDLVKRYHSIPGAGMVMLSPLSIRAEDDLKIQEILAPEGSCVDQGTPLVKFTYLPHGNTAISLVKTAPLPVFSKIPPLKPDRELPEVEKTIRLRQLERTSKENQLTEVLGQLKNLERLASLELVLRQDLTELRRQAEQLKIAINANADEIAELKKYKREILAYQGELRRYQVAQRKYQEELQRARQNQITAQASSTDNTSALTNDQHLIAPIKGQLIKLSRKQHEVALKGEEILQMDSFEHLQIKGYFAEKYQPYLEVGKPVEIEFPDGLKSRGEIIKFYHATLPLPPEFQKKYEPTTRSIIVDIGPIAGQAMEWKVLSNLTVKLSMRR
jgi:biotin carboxyl carrier protein